MPRRPVELLHAFRNEEPRVTERNIYQRERPHRMQVGPRPARRSAYLVNRRRLGEGKPRVCLPSDDPARWQPRMSQDAMDYAALGRAFNASDAHRIHKIIRIINSDSSYHRTFSFCRPPDYARIRQSTHTSTIADTSTIVSPPKYNVLTLRYSFFMPHDLVLSRRKGQDDDGQGPQDEGRADRAGQR